MGKDKTTKGFERHQLWVWHSQYLWSAFYFRRRIIWGLWKWGLIGGRYQKWWWFLTWAEKKSNWDAWSSKYDIFNDWGTHRRWCSKWRSWRLSLYQMEDLNWRDERKTLSWRSLSHIQSIGSWFTHNWRWWIILRRWRGRLSDFWEWKWAL